MTKFTKKEIAALAAAGISFQIEGREIIVAKPYEGELRDGLSGGDIDQRATDRQVKAVCKMFPGVGGFRAGWGGWHLRKGYATTSHDYCDTASPAHY